MHGSLEDTGDGDTAEKIAVIEISDLNLKRFFRIARGRRNGVNNGLEKELQIASISVARGRAGWSPLAMSDAGFRVGVKDREIELVFRSVEIDKETIDLVKHGGGAGIRAVNFIQDDDGGQLGLQGFLQDVARLRKGTFAGVN